MKKLGLGIVAFDATEHLESILTEIKPLIDFILIIKQDISYHGDKIDSVDEQEINRLKEIGLVDEIINFDSILDKNAREQETIKRNMGISYLEKQGCTHVIITDSDEYYNYNEFKKSKDLIYNNEIPITYCRYINYYKDYTHYLIMPFKCYVPFIFESKYRFQFNCTDFTEASDPTRRIKKPLEINNYIFDWNDLKMHHFSWIRNDIRKKINNWSAKKYFNDELIDKAVKSFNEWNDGEEVILLFNVPGNKLKVAKLPKQYVFPLKHIS